MKSLLKRVILLGVFGAVVAGITFQIATSSAARHDRTSRVVARLINADLEPLQAAYHTRDLAEDTEYVQGAITSASECGEEAVPTGFEIHKTPEPAIAWSAEPSPNSATAAAVASAADADDVADPYAATVQEILRIRGRVAAHGAGDVPTDPDSQREFAAALREVIAREQQLPCATEPALPSEPAVPSVGGVNVGIAERRTADAAEAPPAFYPPQPPPVADSRNLLPPFVATVHTRPEVVGALRQIGRQIDTLAADLEDQQQFDEAESLRILVQAVRAEARRLETDAPSRLSPSPPPSPPPSSPPSPPPPHGSGPPTLLPQ
jgi:hypothetical protein